MKVDLMPGIKSISGKNGNMVFRTFKRPDGETETRAYLLPRKGWDARKKKNIYGYTRTTKLSDKELEARSRFARFSEIFKHMPEETKQKYAREMKAAKYKFNGKKYSTLRGYIMARLYAEQGC